MQKRGKEDLLTPPDDEFIRSLLSVYRFAFDIDREIFAFDSQFSAVLRLSETGGISLQKFLEFLPPGDQEHIRMFLLPLREGLSQVLEKDFRVNVADQTKWLRMHARLAEPAESCSNRVLAGIFQDITAYKQERADLTESERWFKEVLEESPHAMYRVDYRANRFDYISRGFADSLGQSREEILDVPYTDFMTRMHPEDMIKIRSDLDFLLCQNRGQRFTYHCEFRYRLHSDDYVWLEDTFTVVPGADGQYAWQVGFGSVIEIRKKLEEQLHQARTRLEEKVRERTAELQLANEKLQQMMAERRELEKKLLAISERERRFIGRELHDGLSQQIVGVMCMFEAIRYRLEQKRAAEASELQMMRDYLFGAVQQVRALSRGLCPLALEPKAVGAALSTLAAQTTLLYKINCSFDGMLDLGVEEPEAALHLYRISQEAIQNAVRHGGAKNININLRGESADLWMQIENDGSPLNPEKCETDGRRLPSSGIGLKLIDYRVGMLGGTWKIASLGERGVRLTISAPIRTEVIE